MQDELPAPGSVLWIRQQPWRVASMRRAGGAIVCCRVEGAGGSRTFLAPFDRVAHTACRRPRRINSRAVAARLSALIGRASSYRGLTSAIDATIDILPFQLEPALAMLNGADRILLADAVGLGKTIQAGLLLKELMRRLPCCRSLILVPSSLRRQWTEELRAHFGIEAQHADAATMTGLAKSADRRERLWDRPGVWLSSLDYVKQPHVLSAVTDRLWDVVVIDEAHTACGESIRHDAAAAIARLSRRLLLLTATPHSGDPVAFDRLLSLGRLPGGTPAPIVFRRSRDVLGARPSRRVRWTTVPLRSNEARVFDAIDAFERAMIRRSADAGNAGLLSSVFRKRALSTAAALNASLDRRWDWLQGRPTGEAAAWTQPGLFEADEDALAGHERRALAADIGVAPSVEQSWIRRLRELARMAARHESKIQCLSSLVRRTGEPVVVFTEFRDSLARVTLAIERLCPTAVVHGGQTVEAQHDEIRRFLRGDARVLLATDVASQGLNLHARCRWVISLELPWNPIRLEQRMGRVDRIGQTRAVHVSTLVVRHGADARMLDRLDRKTSTAAEWLARPPDQRWARAARFLARSIVRKRRLARRWRAAETGGRPLQGSLDRARCLRPFARTGTIFIFRVPLVDAYGAAVEHQVVALQSWTVRPSLEVVARRRCEPRAKRLTAVRRREMRAAAARERSIHDARRQSAGRREAQPGLFDRRADRANGRGMVAPIERDAVDPCVTVGTPRLVLILGPYS